MSSPTDSPEESQPSEPKKNPFQFNDMYPDKDLSDYNPEEAYEMGVSAGWKATDNIDSSSKPKEGGVKASELDEILLPLTVVGGGLDDYGAPTKTEILDDPLYIETKQLIETLIATRTVEARIDKLDSLFYNLYADGLGSMLETEDGKKYECSNCGEVFDWGDWCWCYGMFKEAIAQLTEKGKND